MRKSTRFALLVSVTLIALGLLFVGRPLVGTEQAEAASNPTSRTLPVLMRDGGTTAAQGTAGGILKTTQDGMCYSVAGCVDVNAFAAGALASYSTLVPGRWYEIEVTGDGAGSMCGCLDDNAAIPPAINCGANDAGCWVDASASCTNRPKLKDGKTKYGAFSGAIYCQCDAGCSFPAGADAAVCQCDAGCVREARVWFYAMQSTGMNVSFCPQVPCQ